MSRIMHVLTIVMPLLVSLGIGFFTRKKNILSAEAIEGMKTFVMKFALPAMLFGLFFTAEYSISILLFAATMFAMGVLGLGLGYVFSRPFAKHSPMLRFMTAGWEVGMLGYALYALLFGADNLRYMAVMDFGQVLFVFTVFITALSARSGGSVKGSVKGLLTNPIPWAMVAGAVLAMLGVSRALEPSGVTELITSVCDFVAAPLSCVIFVVVGYGIEFSRKNLGTAVISAVLRTFVCAILCMLALFIIGLFVTLTNEMRWAIILIFLTPAPFILTLYAQNEQERADISMSLSMQTIVTIIAFIGIAVTIV
ncbi:MAG TPA: AEC family transporter [Eubacteriales bacterium]|nr:AEC family transporter [Eubacteriales bacterium]